MAPQGTNEWHLNRHLRLTASNFGGAIGKSNFCTPAKVASDLISQFFLNYDSKFRKQHEIKTEPEAREWYCRTRNVIVAEVGLAVPKWEPRIGASLDGNIVGTDGIIEIKSPLEMYKSLREHIIKIESGWEPPKFYHDHIWESHYAQMQGTMKITGKMWCDYIVYATHSNLSYVERVIYNQTYWDNTLWPGIKTFFSNYMEPMIASNNI